MIAGTVVAWLLVAALALYAQIRKPHVHREAITKGLDNFKLLVIRMPIVVVAISFLITLLPQRFIVERLGEASGFIGILYGSIFGAVLPGGPIVAFPIVVILMKAGAAGGPLVALLTSWTVLALHRLFLFEIPFMGWRFAALRIASSILLPPLAGVLGGLMLHNPTP